MAKVVRHTASGGAMSCTVCLVAAVLICSCHMDLMRLFQSSGAATAAVLKCIEESAARGLVKLALVMSRRTCSPIVAATHRPRGWQLLHLCS